MKNVKNKSAVDRIEALRNAGVDVNNMFAMTGANGGEYVATTQNGKLTMLDDDDPIFKLISEQGTVPNSRLFRRWVMSQMFHMLSYSPYRTERPMGVTQMIHRLGYDYQWKMLLDELYAQSKMEYRDHINFTDRNRWFNREVVAEMARDYIKKLELFIRKRSEKRCKGVPYKRIAGRNIFVEDIHNKVFAPLNTALLEIKQAQNASQLHQTAKRFNELRVKLPYDTPQGRVWIDAYKGSGAFFTMQNLIRFHNCTIVDDRGKRLNGSKSLSYLDSKAQEYSDCEGWRLLAMLKKLLDDNNIDIKAKQKEWRKR